MITMNFHQVLHESGSKLLVSTTKLPLPELKWETRLNGGEGFETPYLRRRMRSRLRGHCG